MLNRESKVAKGRVTKLVLAFFQSEIENLRTEVESGSSSFFNTQMLYTTFAHTIAYRIYNARNQKFVLKSEHGDVSMTILMGSSIQKTTEVTIKKEKICYRKI